MFIKDCFMSSYVVIHDLSTWLIKFKPKYLEIIDWSFVRTCSIHSRAASSIPDERFHKCYSKKSPTDSVPFQNLISYMTRQVMESAIYILWSIITYYYIRPVHTLMLDQFCHDRISINALQKYFSCRLHRSTLFIFSMIILKRMINLCFRAYYMTSNCQFQQ